MKKKKITTTISSNSDEMNNNEVIYKFKVNVHYCANTVIFYRVSGALMCELLMKLFKKNIVLRQTRTNVITPRYHML